MRRARLTWQGAFHHVMNRGISGLPIFSENDYKVRFLKILEDSLKSYKIRLFAYCLMDNHYHLVLENTTGRLADFMKVLNGRYGFYYRKMTTSRGYVFQNRFKSTLIENESYLIQSILYVLQNPVRAGLIQNLTDYTWSSFHCYFTSDPPDWLDVGLVENILGKKVNIISAVGSLEKLEKVVLKTKFGDVMGNVGFYDRAVNRFDRRNEGFSPNRKRKDDRYFEPVEKVIQEFEKKYGVNIGKIDVRTLAGKKIRKKFMMILKDMAGLKYSEIVEMDLFSDLQLSSLRSIYRHERKKRNRTTNARLHSPSPIVSPIV